MAIYKDAYVYIFVFGINIKKENKITNVSYLRGNGECIDISGGYGIGTTVCVKFSLTVL